MQQRGAAVIKARGASSAASAANAALETVRNIVHPTPDGEVFSGAVCSDGSYGVEPGLICGFPLVSDGVSWKIAAGYEHNDFAQGKIQASVDELKTERDTVKDLLP